MYATHFTPAPPIQHHQPIISLTGPPLDHHHQPSPQQQRRLLPAFVQDFTPRDPAVVRASSAPEAAPVVPTQTVFLSRLSPTCTEAQLTSLGSPYGLVKSARFVPKEGEGKSYGFIMLASAAQAQACILGLTDKGYKCGFARETLKEKLERLADPYETNLYVKNLPPNYSQEALEHLFIPNVVVSSKMLESHSGSAEGKGVALVRLQSREEAHQKVDELHGQILPGASSPLVVRFADNTAQKVVREEAARAKRMSPLSDSSYSPNSQWGSPQTQGLSHHILVGSPPGLTPDLLASPFSPASSPFLGAYSRLPTGFGVNPYFSAAQLNFAHQLTSQSSPAAPPPPPPPGMGSPQVAPFIPSSQRTLAYQAMVGQMLNGGAGGKGPRQPGGVHQTGLQLLGSMPEGGAGGAIGLGITGPFGKELGAGGEEYALRW